jgi:hypothetical protein
MENNPSFEIEKAIYNVMNYLIRPRLSVFETIAAVKD